MFMPKKPRKKLTNAQQRDLDIEIGFIEGVVQRDPQYVEALQILGDDYTRRGHFENGLRIDEELAKLRPDDPTVLYNLACSYALTAQFEAAVETLCRAMDEGYSDFKWLMRDPDLKKLRAHARFKVVRERLRMGQAKM
jgi:tetratricopeptide (TPR) repeat protein